MSAAGTSMRDRLDSLASCGDAASLRYAVRELCAEFGKVTRIDIFTMDEAEKRRALCFLRLESAAQERRLMRTLGASRFGDDVLIIVNQLGSHRRQLEEVQGQRQAAMGQADRRRPQTVPIHK
jgi:hypothetical protein